MRGRRGGTWGRSSLVTRAMLVVVVVAAMLVLLVLVVVTVIVQSCSASSSLTHSPNWQSYLVAFLYWLDVWSLSSMR